MAIAVVTAALIVVLSVFNGFENLVKSLYADFYTDIKITAAKGKWFEVDEKLKRELLANAAVAQWTPVVEERAILVDGEDKSIVWLKGVLPEYGGLSRVANHLIRGSFELGSKEQPALVLGGGVESALQIAAGESLYPVTTYLPNRLAHHTTDPLEALHSANAYATGAFGIQQEFDNQYVFTNIAFMRYMLNLSSAQVSSAEIQLQPGADESEVAEALQKALGPHFIVRTRFQQNQGLYVAMQVEKLIIYAVAFLILLIAAFNIMSTLSMLVLEKQRDISVLHALGAVPGRISTIYLKLGAILAGIGALAGFALGAFICWGQSTFHWVKLGGQSFIIDYYPVAMRWLDFVLIAAIIVCITLLAAVLPARKVGRFTGLLKGSA